MLGLTSRATAVTSRLSLWSRLRHRRYAQASATWAIEAATAKIEAISRAELPDVEVSRQKRALEPLIQVVRQYESLQKAARETTVLARDEDMKDLCAAELESLRSQSDNALNDLANLLLPSAVTANLPVLLSLNAGVGGVEATLCTQLLSRMYERYAEQCGWTVETISCTAGGTVGRDEGIREITLRLSSTGDDVYGRMQWESGVHRIQRVPPNDAMARIQTSTVAVIVLAVYPETDTDLVDPKDVRTEVMRSRGAGGQHVNKTESAVRLTHAPTGITVSMQDSRSQHQNRAWAWEVLRARLAERQHDEQVAARRDARQQEVKTADRSERIRTYNRVQDRLTDHRIGLSLGNLSAILAGDLDQLFHALQEDYNDRRIASLVKGEGDLDR